jgi:hypothetical protein
MKCIENANKVTVIIFCLDMSFEGAEWCMHDTKLRSRQCKDGLDSKGSLNGTTKE